MEPIKKTFCRVIGIILSALMAAQGYMPTVYAETKSAKQSIHKPAITLDNEAADKSSDDFADESVVVMFEDDARFSKKRAKRVLTTGTAGVDDIKVKEVWNFDNSSDENKGAADDTASVALVSSDTLDGTKLVRKLAARSDIRYAERNHKVHALKVSDDEYSDFQWSMQDSDVAPNVNYEWNTKNMKGAENKVVAVVDTGIDYTHPDLKDNMWKNTHYSKLKGVYGYDFVNGDGDPMDDNGHGTHCAGIIGAVGNNKTGISGVNQKIKIMALKILDAEGSSELSHEIAAYNYINAALDLGEPIVAINNSWGGGEESDIMKELIDIVGSKGAVSVCAAGNDGSSNDDEPQYPADVDSEYIISVAAFARNGQLAPFSNYGESVDIAAPGADILSTVSENTYLPTIYNEAKQDKVSEKYNGYEDDANTWGLLTEDDIYIDGMPYKEYVAKFEDSPEEDRPLIKFSIEEGNALDDSGKHLVIEYKNMEPDALICVPMKYTLSENYKTLPRMSVMASVDGPAGAGDFFGVPLFGFIETSQDKELTVDSLGAESFQGTAIEGEAGYWSHIEARSYMSSDPEPGDERQFIMTLYAYGGGDFKARIDDLGLSRQDIAEDDFEKYDVYSGTSMATPYITGSVALKTAEAEAEGNDRPEATDIINELTQMVKPTEPALPTASEGLFDFSKIPIELAPRISRVTVDPDKNEVRIWGSGLAPKGTDVKVEIGDSDENMKQAVIKEQDKKYIVVENDGWINNVENIKVTAFGPKPAVKKGVYLVKGKKEYKEKKDSYFYLSDDAITTDGKYIYNSNSRGGEISYFDPSAKDAESESLGVVDTDKIFNMKKDPKKKYAMLFGKDIVYINNAVYTVVEYGAAEEKEPEYDDDFWFFSDKKNMSDDEDYGDDDDDEFEGGYSIYSGEYRLVKFDIGADSEEAAGLGKLPESLEQSEDYTMAAYNGKLYFIGGHSYAGGDQGLTASVHVYDPVTKKWSTASDLPEARANGKAVQYKDKLIYTLADGEEENEAAKKYDMFIFDGSKWEKIVPEKEPELFYEEDRHDINVVKNGILFTGGAAKDYGDTFVYDMDTKKYTDTGYNFIKEFDEYQARTIAIGNTLYAIDTEGGIYTMPVDSGFIKITGSKKGNGKLTGTGWIVPGNDAKITVKAAKNSIIKSIKVNGKAIKVKKNAVKQIVSIRRPAKDQAVSVEFAKVKQVKVTVSKKGKGKVTGAGKYTVGKNVKLKMTAAKGNYIKSLKVAKKNIKLNGKAAKKVYTIKKIKKNIKVKVIFAKK